ncbi:MAG: hypothetical protein INQ03_16965 [Candidatus Heimdallarchaeota archaeon]|nr:hypothetical protein [Candidatus Heimdallarchaeota archaeon]
MAINTTKTNTTITIDAVTLRKLISYITSFFDKKDEEIVKSIEQKISEAFNYSEDIEKARIRQSIKKPEVKFYPI